MIIPVRLSVLLCFSTLLCTCGPAQNANNDPTVVIGNIRYDEGTQLLEANLTVSPVPTSAPAVLGNTLNPLTGMGAGHYRGRQQTEFTDVIDLSIPGQPAQVIRFSAPFADSIPAVLRKSRTAKIPAMRSGLTDAESLVFFLEPADRSTPKRILLQGPSNSGTLTLPKESITDVKPGRYSAYFVKQQLQKDSSATLETSLQTEYFTEAIPIEVKE
jgi:hypothetical protein